MIEKFNVKEKIVKQVVKFGNGSIVYTPKKWLGKKVLVILEEPSNVEDAILLHLKDFMPNIKGIFLFGSFARNENSLNSDIDVLVISEKKLKIPKKGNFDLTVLTENELISKLEKDSDLFLFSALHEAKPILNAALLGELKNIKVKPNFGKFFDKTLTAFKNISKLLQVDIERNEKFLTAPVCVYSLILRLKTIFLIQCFFKNKKFSSKLFREFILDHNFEKKVIDKFFNVFREERDNNPSKTKLLLKDTEKLFEFAKIQFLETEDLVKKWEKRKNIKKQ